MAPERGLKRRGNRKQKELSEIGSDALFPASRNRAFPTLVSKIQCEVKIGFEAMTHAHLNGTPLPIQDGGTVTSARSLPLRAIIPDADIASLPRIIPPVVPLPFSHFSTVGNKPLRSLPAAHGK